MYKKISLKWAQITKLLSRWVQAPAYVYLLVASLAVICFAFITPPFQGPDEEAHYIRTQYIAHGYFVPVDVNSTSASLPQSIEDVLMKTFFADDLRGKTAETYDLYRTKAAINIPLNEELQYKPMMITYSPLAYLPAVPGVFIANQLNLSPLISMYIARLSLGLVSVFLVFMAIKFIPHKKYLFAVVGLIPMLLFQQAMVTVDGVSYSLLALFIAYVLYLRSIEVVNKKQWIILGLICVGIIFVKPPIYLFLPLILMAIKKRTDFKWVAIITGVCAAALLSWSFISAAHGSDGEVAPLPNGANQQLQLANLVEHPSRIFRVVWNSYMTPYGDDEVRGIIGLFGAADTAYPLWMFSMYVVLLGILCVLNFDQKRTKNIDKRWKILVVILCAGYFAAVNLALYLGYSPLNFDIIYGVQGRYFLPILIVGGAVLFTGGLTILRKDEFKVKIWIVTSVITLVLLALFITFQRYFLYTP